MWFVSFLQHIAKQLESTFTSLAYSSISKCSLPLVLLELREILSVSCVDSDKACICTDVP